MKIRIIFLLFLFVSCHPLFCNWDSDYNQLTKEPSKSKIVGTYELSKDSQDYLGGNFNLWPLKLQLLENGKFIFLSNKNQISKSDKIFASKSDLNRLVENKVGKWIVSCSNSTDCLIELEGLFVTPFSEKNGQLAIPITIGDGDECNGIVYEKLK
jgi:hypothetical protein